MKQKLASLFSLGLLFSPSVSLPAFFGQSTSPAKGYIVVFKDSAAKTPFSLLDELSIKHSFTFDHVYTQVMSGFAAQLTEPKKAALLRDDRVEYIVEDQEVHTFAQTLPRGIDRVDADLNTANSGSGIAVAVLDTGISLSHPDLIGSIVAQKNCVKPTRSANDDNGHGTHVAGTIAARSNTTGVVGVAPQAKLAAVKVLNAQGSGTWSQIICGIDWVTANANRYNIKVANLSLGGAGSSDNNCGFSNNDPLHRAICRSRDAGVTYVVAAGNSAKSISTTVPASYDDAVITVSALADSDGKSGGLGVPTSYGADDTFATFSNYGSGVDIAAPGVNIYSTYKNSSYATMSGTSMATPHVAGAAALYLKTNPGATWTQVRDGLKAKAEALGSGHTDPTGKFPEPVLKANSL